MDSFSSRRPRRTFNAEINVVPYIDVMLVLLVIFMITAPLLTQGINVNLPRASGKSLPSKQRTIIVSVDSAGRYYLNTAPHPTQAISPQTLMTDVYKQINKSNKPAPNVYVKGDKSVRYGDIMHAMVLLQKAGAQHIGLITKDLKQSS